MSDGLLSRYTRQLESIKVGETTHHAEDGRTRHARPRPHPRPQQLGVLILRQGQESDRAFELRQDYMTIGRSRENDIVLEDHSVSHVHAIITRDDEGIYRIRDQDSTNGTYVNSLRIFEHVLEDADEIRVGMTELAFRQQW